MSDKPVHLNACGQTARYFQEHPDMADALVKAVQQHYGPPQPPPGKCHWCWGVGKVEFTGSDGTGVYDPCFACDGTGNEEDMKPEWR